MVSPLDGTLTRGQSGISAKADLSPAAVDLVVKVWLTIESTL